MIDERAQAISFAEYYFALVDGIFPGLENHLAKNVVLDWFGRKIKGKKNVIAFMKSDRTSTLHIFTRITPISGIIRNKKQHNRKRRVTLNQIADIEEEKLDTETNKQKASQTWKKYKNVVKHLDGVEIINYTTRESNGAGIEADDRDMNEENDPSSDLLGPEITSDDDDGEFQRNINESKLEEEMASTVKPIKRERGQGDRTVRAQTGAIKYVEANGQIKFTQKVLQEDPWSYHWTSLEINYWMHNCKLQIAYSRRNVNEQRPGVLHTLKQIPSAEESEKSNSNREVQLQKKLPTLEEIIAIGNGLIPDVDNFGGYLKPLNYAKDREDFLKDFEATMRQKNPDACLPTVHFVGSKLVLKYKDNAHKERLVRKFLDGAYRIHKIVYKKVETDGICAEPVAIE